jgi:hypothetical protein
MQHIMIKSIFLASVFVGTLVKIFSISKSCIYDVIRHNAWTESRVAEMGPAYCCIVFIVFCFLFLIVTVLIFKCVNAFCLRFLAPRVLLGKSRGYKKVLLLSLEVMVAIINVIRRTKDVTARETTKEEYFKSLQ